MANGLPSVNHVVVLMLENRSFDHMLGFLYSAQGNVSPAGQPYEGLAGTESNPDASGQPVPVFRIEPTTPNAYFMPGADPGEGYMATNDQLFGNVTAPASPAAPPMQGFVKDFAYTLGWQSRSHGWTILPGTVASDIMGCFTPAALPVLSALAQGYAVCDHWYSSAPTETLPNRAFACAATSQGHMDDKTRTFTSPSIFGLLGQHGLSWGIYGYDAEPLTIRTFTDIAAAAGGTSGKFTDFQAAAAAGTLPAFTFLEPAWSATGNSQHPNYDVALGERLIHDVYETLRAGPGVAADAARHHLRRARRLLRPRAAAVRRGAAGQLGRRVRLRLHPLRGPGAGRDRLAADRAGHRLPGSGRRRAARPHRDPQDRPATLEPARADRQGRGRARLRRRPHADRAADR